MTATLAPTRPPLTIGDLTAIPITQIVERPDKIEALTNLGIRNAADLLTWYPRRWIDRTKQAPISLLQPGMETFVVGHIAEIVDRPGKSRPMITAKLTDSTGELGIVFFNQPWRIRQLPAGSLVAVFGKITAYQGRLQLTNPVVDLIGDQVGRLIPIYPSSDREGLNSAELHKWITQTLARCATRGIADPIPAEILTEHRLPSRAMAMAGIHNADSVETRNWARHRLVFDELFRLQLILALRKARVEAAATGIAHHTSGIALRQMLAGLPFPLTGAQTRAIADITADMTRPVPMHRLLQGDVGAGKTLVAFGAMLNAVEAGHQACLMAPTEVLAEQHLIGISKLAATVRAPDPTGFEGDRPMRVELITNKVTGKRRAAMLEALAAGDIDILVGTHALIEPAVKFADMSLAVIDEQHRFGVEQREALRNKRVDGRDPHILVMTATPIPRTAAMTVYGDLDMSILNELPPGRTPIVTRWANGDSEHPIMWQQVRDEIAAGRQAYVVCPLVEDSGKMQAAAAEATHQTLSEGELAGLRLGLLHGKMKPDLKDAVMSAFRAGDLDVLVATTVIEVGVDVPNSTVMVILDADRFGIAQLHQLRGRVGRGRHASTCWLATPEYGEEGNPRVEALVASTDGFELAEVDLALRGEGTILSDKQNGRSDLKLAGLQRDRGILVKARQAAFAVVADDPTLANHPALAAELAVTFDGVDDSWLSRS